MNTICKFADIDTYLLYFINIKSVLAITEISKEQYIHMTNLAFIKQLRALVKQYGYKNMIDKAVTHNYISLIKWISESSVRLQENKFKYTYAVEYATIYGYIDLLNWFANSEHEFKYYENTINYAVICAHFDVLNWYANSKYEFKYTPSAIDNALMKHKLEILKWFDESKYEIKYTPEKIKQVLKEGDCTDIYDYLGPNSRIIKILDSQKID